jgi:Asp-tRNA(Asn)/Glu-tRNA(Gln) amidotransferase A subunit family amidase
MENAGRIISRIALVSLVICSGCSALPGTTKELSGNRAFVQYWPAEQNSKQLRLAIKDNIDMKGVVTTAGSKLFDKMNKPAKADASCLALARQRNVHMVGKTNLTEFAIAPSGINEYFGTPENPLRHSRIPGGSSSGNAVALASGMADVAIGTDTAGSVRVPAACCGIVGLKTTFGLVPLKGVYPVEARHLDTVGPMARDIAHTVEGMELLQGGFAAKYAAAKSAQPTGRSIRVGRLKLKGTDPKIDAAIDDALARAGFQVVPLDDQFRQRWEDAKADGTTVAAAGAWITNEKHQFSLDVSGRSKSTIRVGGITYNTTYRAALGRQRAWQKTLNNVFEKVDFIALPTLQTAPPALPPFHLRLGVLEARVLGLQNTVSVNFAGNPALAMPVPVLNESVPVTSLQLVGPRLSEAKLLNAGRIVEQAVKTR